MTNAIVLDMFLKKDSTKGVCKGVIWGWNPPLSLIFYKNFITCAQEINCFRIPFAC